MGSSLKFFKTKWKVHYPFIGWIVFVCQTRVTRPLHLANCLIGRKLLSNLYKYINPRRLSEDISVQWYVKLLSWETKLEYGSHIVAVLRIRIDYYCSSVNVCLHVRVCILLSFSWKKKREKTFKLFWKWCWLLMMEIVTNGWGVLLQNAVLRK